MLLLKGEEISAIMNHGCEEVLFPIEYLFWAIENDQSHVIERD